jgi:hypothetical protein
LNALPIAGSNDWLALPSRQEAQIVGAGRQCHSPAAFAPEAELLAPESDQAQRLSLAQQGFLELRLEAALSRLAAMETLLDAERLYARQAQTALAVAERALERHRETIIASDQQRQLAAAEIGRLKQGLREDALERARQGRHIAALTAALANRTAEIDQLKGAGAAVEADLRASRTKHGSASDALQRECLRLEEIVQGERRDKLLLQRALDLARANRRALQDHLHQQHHLHPQPAATRPADDRIALRGPTAADAVPLRLPILPPSQTLEREGPMQPPCPALTEHVHAACN